MVLIRTELKFVNLIKSILIRTIRQLVELAMCPGLGIARPFLVFF